MLLFLGVYTWLMKITDMIFDRNWLIQPHIYLYAQVSVTVGSLHSYTNSYMWWQL